MYIPTGMNTLGPGFKRGLIKPGFISHEKSDLNHGLNHTKTRIDQTRFQPWFYPLKRRSRPDMKNWPSVFAEREAINTIHFHFFQFCFLHTV